MLTSSRQRSLSLYLFVANNYIPSLDTNLIDCFFRNYPNNLKYVGCRSVRGGFWRLRLEPGGPLSISKVNLFPHIKSYLKFLSLNIVDFISNVCIYKLFEYLIYHTICRYVLIAGVLQAKEYNDGNLRSFLKRRALSGLLAEYGYNRQRALRYSNRTLGQSSHCQ